MVRRGAFHYTTNETINLQFLRKILKKLYSLKESGVQLLFVKRLFYFFSQVLLRLFFVFSHLGD